MLKDARGTPWGPVVGGRRKGEVGRSPVRSRRLAVIDGLHACARRTRPTRGGSGPRLQSGRLPHLRSASSQIGEAVPYVCACRAANVVTALRPGPWRRQTTYAAVPPECRPGLCQCLPRLAGATRQLPPMDNHPSFTLCALVKENPDSKCTPALVVYAWARH